MVKRIPISAAKQIAKDHGLSQVILLAWDGERTPVVTYGETLEDCDQAAQGGNRMKAVMGWENTQAEPSRVSRLKASLAKLRAYFGGPTDGDWSGLRPDDAANLGPMLVRVGDLREADKLLG